MELFQVSNNRAFPSTHALLIEPFKTIWDNDPSSFKEEAIKIFTYIELLCNPKKTNPFAGYDDAIRPAKVKQEVWGDDPPNGRRAEIIAATYKYKELLRIASPTYVLYEAAVSAAEKLRKELHNVDFGERTDNGHRVIKPKDVTSALKEIPDVMRQLELLRSKVNQELVEESKTRNQREIGDYER